MKKYNKLFNPQMIVGCVFSFILGALFVVGIFNLRAINAEKKKLAEFKAANSAIEPYYYNPKDLVLPKEFHTKEATNEAKIKIPIVMYHYVEYVKDQGDTIRKGLDVNPAWFEKQLQLLKENNYETYFAKDIPGIISGSIVYNPSKSIVLTFDDGYEDFYTDVFPLLKKYNMRATAYIIYDFLDRKGFMTKDQIYELSNSGQVEIGAHTLDHLYLKTIPESAARTQIFESKKLLEKLIGTPVETFAYPYGAFNLTTVNLVKEASFSAALSVIPGVYQSANNLFFLNRIRPGIFTPSTMIKTLENYSK